MGLIEVDTSWSECPQDQKKKKKKKSAWLEWAQSIDSLTGSG